MKMKAFFGLYVLIALITLNTNVTGSSDPARSRHSTQRPVHAWREQQNTNPAQTEHTLTLLQKALNCFTNKQTIETQTEEFNNILPEEPSPQIRRKKKSSHSRHKHRKTPRKHSVQIATISDDMPDDFEGIETKDAPIIDQDHILPGTPEETKIEPIEGRTFHSLILQDYRSSDDSISEISSITEAEPPSPIRLMHTPHTPPEPATPREYTRPSSAQQYISLRTIIESKNTEIMHLQNQINALESNTLELRNQLQRFLITRKVKPAMHSVGTNTKQNTQTQDKTTQTPRKFKAIHTQTGQCIEQIRKEMLKGDEITHADIIELATELLRYKRYISSQAQETYIKSMQELQTLQYTLATPERQ